MADQTQVIMLAAGLAALLLALSALLLGWRDWLSFKRAQLEARSRPAGTVPSPAGRIELADLKARIRRLEAIADGTE